MTVTNETFGNIAREMKLTPEAATVLTVIARHPRTTDARVRALVDRLRGDAREAALVLLGEASSSKPNVERLVAHLQRWSQAHECSGTGTRAETVDGLV